MPPEVLEAMRLMQAKKETLESIADDIDGAFGLETASEMYHLDRMDRP